jgi:hypothetical protein
MEVEAVEMADLLSGGRMRVEVAIHLGDPTRARAIVASTLGERRVRSRAQRAGGASLEALVRALGDVGIEVPLSSLATEEAPSPDAEEAVAQLLADERHDFDEVLEMLMAADDRARILRLLPLAACEPDRTAAMLAALDTLAARTPPG